MTSFDELRLETPRLVLRPPRADDLDAWAEMMLDEPSARFIGGTMPRAVCWRQLMTMIGAWHAQGFAMFSVIEKESGRWIGRVGPWQTEGWPGTEIGWAIVRQFWGRGYAGEAAAVAREPAVATARAEAGVAESGTGQTATALRRRSRRPLGPEPRGVAPPDSVACEARGMTFRGAPVG